MTIYLDIVLTENLCMNYIILFTTAYILKIKRKFFRIILSALIGGIYSILAYMEITKVYSNIILKVILSIIMIYISYIPSTFKELFKELIMFYLISFVFGGCAFALLYFIKPQEILMRKGILIGTYPLKIAVLGGIVGFIVTVISFYIIKKKIRKDNLYCDITIFFQEEKVSTKALIDTGNMLKDPITNIPVIVVEKDILKNILPEEILNNIQKIINGNISKEIDKEEYLKYISKFRIIPFKSLGKENGILLGFKASKILINTNDEEYQINNIIVGIYEYTLSKDSKYSALVGFDLIEGRDKYEYSTNVSGEY